MWIEILKDGGHWIWENKIHLSILLVVFFNRKSLWKYFIKDPITGGNGMTKPDELAKWLLMASFIGMLFTYQAVSWPMTLFAMVLLSVIGIAKLDKVLDVISTLRQSKKDGMKIDNNKLEK